jgi:hypothetical protein
LQTFDPVAQRAKFDVIQSLKLLFEPPDADQSRHVNVLYTFHAPQSELVAKGILAGSIHALHRNDGGYFGAGVYSTPSLEYAARYAAGDFFPDRPKATSAPFNIDDPPEGCYPVLFCATVVTHVYPVTREDYADAKDPRGKSHFFSSKGQPAKALKPGFDAHFIPVSQPNFQATMAGATPDYYELVCRSDMIVPLGVLWIRDTRNKSPVGQASAAQPPFTTVHEHLGKHNNS